MSHDPLDIWNQIAAHWHEQVGEGNDFQKLLIFPATDRLLSPRRDLRVLDACCGNGNYARRLARLGCEVIAFDGSRVMIELARSADDPMNSRIEYRIVDATVQSEMDSLGDRASFDAIVCAMAMMDLPTIDPLLRAARRLLRDDACFVFSIGHPSFHTNEAVKWATQADALGEGEAGQTFGCLVTRYAGDWAHLSRGLLSQPVPHWLYHRSMTTVLRSCFEAGFVVDGFDEPTFPPDPRLRSPFSWARRHEIPPVIVVRLRPAQVVGTIPMHG